MGETVKMSQVKINALKDPYYRPYCLRCDTMVHMSTVGRLQWRCTRCGAEHDERFTPTPEDGA